MNAAWTVKSALRLTHEGRRSGHVTQVALPPTVPATPALSASHP